MWIIRQDTSMCRALGIHRRRSLWVSDPAKNSLLFQNGCHCHYPYHLLKHIIKLGQFRASWSQLFGLSVMLEHPFCIFSHPGYEHFCISDTYTLHLISKHFSSPVTYQRGSWLSRLHGLCLLEMYLEKLSFLFFPPERQVKWKGVVTGEDEQMNMQKTMGGGEWWEGGGEGKGWEKGNLSYRKYLPWKLIALIGLSTLVCAWLASIWAALGKSLSHSECPLLFLLSPLMSFTFSFFSLSVC